MKEHDFTIFYSRYEVAVGSYEGGTDLRGFTETMEGSISFDKLAMIPGQQAFATVRAVNRAGLVSGKIDFIFYGCFEYAE